MCACLKRLRTENVSGSSGSRSVSHTSVSMPFRMPRRRFTPCSYDSLEPIAQPRVVRISRA